MPPRSANATGGRKYRVYVLVFLVTVSILAAAPAFALSAFDGVLQYTKPIFTGTWGEKHFLRRAQRHPWIQGRTWFSKQGGRDKQRGAGEVPPLFVAGNWKANGDFALLERASADLIGPENVEVVVAPPAIFALPLLSKLRFSTGSSGLAVSVGVQDLSADDEGAFTGEIPARLLVRAGVTWTILGHSERRHKESLLEIGLKLQKALEAGLKVVLCVPDEETDTFTNRLSVVPFRRVSRENLVVAYEPLSAIGSGKAEQLDLLHRSIISLKESFRSLAGRENPSLVLNPPRFIYGGSVTEQNCDELLLAGLQGYLLGKASLNPTSMARIVRKVENKWIDLGG